MKGLTVMNDNSQKKALLLIGKPLSQFFKHLAGDHSMEWVDAFNKFLRKQNPWGNQKSEEISDFDKSVLNQRTAFNLAAWLLASGHYYPTVNGNHYIERTDYTLYDTDATAFGILYGKRQYYFETLHWFRKPRPALGTIFFTGSEWAFHVYGESNMPIVKELCERIEEKFKKKVAIKLMDLNPKEEEFPISW